MHLGVQPLIVGLIVSNLNTISETTETIKRIKEISVSSKQT